MQPDEPRCSAQHCGGGTPRAPHHVLKVLDAIPDVEKIEEYFDFDREKHVLGSGMYANVYRALPSAEGYKRFAIPKAAWATDVPDGTSAAPSYVALKEVRISSIGDVKEARNVLREISVLRRLRHPHVVGFHAAVRTKHSVFIVMPLAPGVTLTRLLEIANREQTPIPEKTARCIVRQLLLALRYLHSAKGMIHRDVKLDNVLVSVTERDSSPGTPTSSDHSAATAPPSSPVARTASTNKPSANTAQSTTAGNRPLGTPAGDDGAAFPAAPSTTTGRSSTAARPADPESVFNLLFVPGCDVHVTLVDFGFARTVPVAMSPAMHAAPVGHGSDHAQGGPQAAQLGTSPVGTPTTNGSFTAGSTCPFPQVPAGVTATRNRDVVTPAGLPVVSSDTKLQYTPCGAPRYMPPEVLSALVAGAATASPRSHVAHSPRTMNTAPAVSPVDSAAESSAGGSFSNKASPVPAPARAAAAVVRYVDHSSSVSHGGTAVATPAQLRKTDPFAVGVVAYAVLSLNFPWQGDTPTRLLDTMQHGVRMRASAWADVSDDAKDFVRGLLKLGPEDRMSVEQAMEHRWFQRDGVF